MGDEMAHSCHARKCAATCPPTHLMCRRHWAMVPEAIKSAVWRAYAPGQCNLTPIPTEEWHVAADAAIGAVGVLDEGADVDRVKAWVGRHGGATPMGLLDALERLR